MFEQPPEFLLPVRDALANLTAWFDWGALGAVGTVGALWFAVVQSSMSARAERAKAVGILTTLIGLIEPLSEAIPIYDGGEKDRLTLQDYRELLRSKPLMTRAIDGLHSFSVVDVASVNASDYVSALPLTIEGIIGLFPTTLSGTIKASEINDYSRHLGEAVEFFREKRDFIEHGYVGTQLRRLLRRARWRLWMWRWERRSKQVPATDAANGAPEDAPS